MMENENMDNNFGSGAGNGEDIDNNIGSKIENVSDGNENDKDKKIEDAKIAEIDKQTKEDIDLLKKYFESIEDQKKLVDYVLGKTDDLPKVVDKIGDQEEKKNIVNLLKEIRDGYSAQKGLLYSSLGFGAGGIAGAGLGAVGLGTGATALAIFTSPFFLAGSGAFLLIAAILFTTRVVKSKTRSNPERSKRLLALKEFVEECKENIRKDPFVKAKEAAELSPKEIKPKPFQKERDDFNVHSPNLEKLKKDFILDEPIETNKKSKEDVDFSFSTKGVIYEIHRFVQGVKNGGTEKNNAIDRFEKFWTSYGKVANDPKMTDGLSEAAMVFAFKSDQIDRFKELEHDELADLKKIFESLGGQSIDNGLNTLKTLYDEINYDENKRLPIDNLRAIKEQIENEKPEAEPSKDEKKAEEEPKEEKEEKEIKDENENENKEEEKPPKVEDKKEELKDEDKEIKNENENKEEEKPPKVEDKKEEKLKDEDKEIKNENENKEEEKPPKVEDKKEEKLKEEKEEKEIKDENANENKEEETGEQPPKDEKKAEEEPKEEKEEKEIKDENKGKEKPDGPKKQEKKEEPEEKDEGEEKENEKSKSNAIAMKKSSKLRELLRAKRKKQDEKNKTEKTPLTDNQKKKLKDLLDCISKLKVTEEEGVKTTMNDFNRLLAKIGPDIEPENEDDEFYKAAGIIDKEQVDNLAGAKNFFLVFAGKTKILENDKHSQEAISLVKTAIEEAKKGSEYGPNDNKYTLNTDLNEALNTLKHLYDIYPEFEGYKFPIDKVMTIKTEIEKEQSKVEKKEEDTKIETEEEPNVENKDDKKSEGHKEKEKNEKKYEEDKEEKELEDEKETKEEQKKQEEKPSKQPTTATQQKPQEVNTQANTNPNTPPKPENLVSDLEKEMQELQAKLSEKVEIIGDQAIIEECNRIITGKEFPKKEGDTWTQGEIGKIEKLIKRIPEQKLNAFIEFLDISNQLGEKMIKSLDDEKKAGVTASKLLLQKVKEIKAEIEKEQPKKEVDKPKEEEIKNNKEENPKIETEEKPEEENKNDTESKEHEEQIKKGKELRKRIKDKIKAKEVQTQAETQTIVKSKMSTLKNAIGGKLNDYLLSKQQENGYKGPLGIKNKAEFEAKKKDQKDTNHNDKEIDG